MSAKTSTQPGRRTPLSLSGAVTKSHPNKSANGGGTSSNGHTTSNTNRQDSKLQQQKSETQIVNTSEIKENANKKQQPQTDKKQQQNDNKKSNEKGQNGVSNNKDQQSNENKQQHQNGNGCDNKLNEKDKNEKTAKSDKVDKSQEKSEKEENKLKEDKKVEQDKVDNKKDERKPKESKEQEKLDNKKDEKKSKETRDAKENKNEETTKGGAVNDQHPNIKSDDKKSEEGGSHVKIAEQKTDEKMDVVEEKQTPKKSNSATPKSNTKANKATTPINKTPINVSEKTPQKLMPTNAGKTTTFIKRDVTTTIDNNDIEMEPLIIEGSPIKSSQPVEVINTNNLAPSATSTPGKMTLPKRSSGAPKSDVQLAMYTKTTPERPRAFSQISGRRSIRPISDYTPSKYQSNSQFREYYRRINTELDVTNTSMDVTVGSEVASNLSFSFFGRGRKRDHTPSQYSQSAIGELQTEMEVCSPKKARIDMHGFFSAVASPLSLLRNRFSKASLQSSTPVKLQLDTVEDEIEVQNVSGVSEHDEISKSDKEPAETINDGNEETLGEEAKENSSKADVETEEGKDTSSKCEKPCGMEQASEHLDIEITETPLQPAIGDPIPKNKRCVVM